MFSFSALLYVCVRERDTETEKETERREILQVHSRDKETKIGSRDGVQREDKGEKHLLRAFFKNSC